MTKRYLVTTNVYMYDDNGNYVNDIVEDEVIDQAEMDWYQSQQGMAMADGSIFYILECKELA